MNPMAIDHGILTVKEVSELLKILSARFIRWSGRAGFLPSRSVQTGDSKKLR
jgi:hypothetical protein